MSASPARTAPCLPAPAAGGNARPLAAALAALLALLRALLGPAAIRHLLASPTLLARLRTALAAGAHPAAALWPRRTLSPAQRRRARARLIALRTAHHVALPPRRHTPGPAAIRRAAARLRALAHGIWHALPPYPPILARTGHPAPAPPPHADLLRRKTAPGRLAQPCAANATL